VPEDEPPSFFTLLRLDGFYGAVADTAETLDPELLHLRRFGELTPVEQDALLVSIEQNLQRLAQEDPKAFIESSFLWMNDGAENRALVSDPHLRPAVRRRLLNANEDVCRAVSDVREMRARRKRSALPGWLWDALYKGDPDGDD
jgi:hypothetical protein